MGRQRKSTADRVAEAENGDGGGTATIDEAPVAMEGQGEMFPELDLSKPEEKAAYNAAKLYRKKRNKRAELLKDAKAEEDAAREKLVAAMGALHIKKFKLDGIRAEVIDGKAKVRVTTDDDEEDDDNDGDE